MSRLGQGLYYYVRHPHRCGYGIHSPFVYRLTRDLLRRSGRGVAGGISLSERLMTWLSSREPGLLHNCGLQPIGRQPGEVFCAEGDLTQTDPDALLRDLGRWQERDILVLHRIHATSQTWRCWTALQQHPGVTVTIDLWNTGIVFFDRRLHRQQFVIFAPRRLRR